MFFFRFCPLYRRTILGARIEPLFVPHHHPLSLLVLVSLVLVLVPVMVLVSLLLVLVLMLVMLVLVSVWSYFHAERMTILVLCLLRCLILSQSLLATTRFARGRQRFDW
jgi:hypothetical protein